ncbi:MAG: hypothetical protein FH753_04180 [Firmicutes bacterium]|nr:hypothetical protein [Bacillota bacterium]
MIYEKSNLTIYSDFEIRTVREENKDIDILIPIENRTVNMNLDDLPEYIDSRIQFPLVKNIIIRYNTTNDNNTCTIHLLRSIDLQSSMVNLVIDYTKHHLEIRDKSFYIDFRLKKNK